MLLPDFSRLSLTTPTAAPGTAADAVLSNQALIAAILFNIRYGNVDSVCEAVVNWCTRVSKTNRQACNADENPELWRDLTERIFPNMRQEVFPPIGSPALGPFIRHFEFNRDLSETDLPWSGSPLAMSWQAWLFVLCDDYLRKRQRFQMDVAAKRAARERAARDARMHEERYEDFEDRLPDPRVEGGPPNQRIVKANARKLEPYRAAAAASQVERQKAAHALQTSRSKLLYHRTRYGRTADHEKYDAQQRRPAHGAEARGSAYDNFDDEILENAETEDGYSNNSEGEDQADENWRERNSDDDDAGVDG